MEVIYRSAVHVVVVDPLLRDMAFDGNSEVEMAARVVTSPWWTRCWTLQEGMLARSLVFSLRDATLNPLNWVRGGKDQIGFEKALQTSVLAAVRAFKTRKLPLTMENKLEAGMKSAVLRAYSCLPKLETSQSIDKPHRSIKGLVGNLAEAYERLEGSNIDEEESSSVFEAIGRSYGFNIDEEEISSIYEAMARSNGFNIDEGENFSEMHERYQDKLQ